MENGVSTPPPVVIAGGGVVGVTLALALARRGVSSVVLEKQSQPHTLPRAHAVNPRSIEILRELGISGEQLREIAAPPELTSHVRFVTTMTGRCFGTLPYERQGASSDSLAAVGTLNVPQPGLELLLFAAVADEPFIDLRRGHQWEAAHQDGHGVMSTIRTGQSTYSLRSKYLVAADGASSDVRESLGITMSGPADLASAVSMTFSADLSGFLKTRPAVLNWIFGTPLKGTLICYLPDRLWSYVVMRAPGQVDMTPFHENHVVDLIRAALGPDAVDTPIEVIAVTPWTLQSQVADSYQLGRIFIAGDAAHRFPPTGGLGLNTGLQDAHNLAWKLAAVIDGWASPEMLQSYEGERRPIACRNAEQSLKNLEATAALSILDEAAHAEDTNAFTAEPDHARQIAEAIELQRPHFDSVALQLGFSYSLGTQPIDDVTQFSSRALPGRRLPHGWMLVAGTRRPILDLIDPNGFTVLLFDSDLPASAQDVSAPITVRRMDSRQSDVRNWMAEVGLTGTAGVLVRPDGHILDVADRPEDLIRFGEAVRRMLAPSGQPTTTI